MNLLVLGGTSFIGPWAVRGLARRGHQVTLFHRGKTSAPDLPAGVRHLHGDRAQLPSFRSEFERLAPEVVLDMRALSEADARAVAETIRGIARRCVVISSIDV